MSFHSEQFINNQAVQHRDPEVAPIITLITCDFFHLRGRVGIGHYQRPLLVLGRKQSECTLVVQFFDLFPDLMRRFRSIASILAIEGIA